MAWPMTAGRAMANCENAKVKRISSSVFRMGLFKTVWTSLRDLLDLRRL